MLTYWGQFEVYPGGGYVVNLGDTLQEATERVAAARASNWIDEHTKAIFIEFNVWNANTNLFNLVIIGFEFRTTGVVGISHFIDVILLYRYTGAGGLITLLAEVLLLIFMIVKLVLEVLKIVRQRRQYFHQLGNIAMLFAIGLYLTAFGWYVWRSVLTVRTVEFMMNNRGA